MDLCGTNLVHRGKAKASLPLARGKMLAPLASQHKGSTPVPPQIPDFQVCLPVSGPTATSAEGVRHKQRQFRGAADDFIRTEHEYFPLKAKMMTALFDLCASLFFTHTFHVIP
jgi:hypothetical protein